MPLFSFTRSQRLLTTADFGWVFAQAEYKVSDRNFLLLARTSQIPNQSHSRIGLVVAKKHAKLAVQRNFIKRTLRESFRLFQAKQPFAPNLDIVVLTRPGISTVDAKQLRSMIDSHWPRLAKKHHTAQQKATNTYP